MKIIACPTCGRTDPELDLPSLAREIETACIEAFGEKLAARGASIEIAVMGCEVNGPGEASHADFGVAGARKGRVLLFARGKKMHLVDSSDAADELVKAVLESGIV